MDTDRDRIVNLLARYCFVVDRGTGDEIAALFCDDARLEFNGTHVGAQAIRDCYADWIRTMRDPVEGLRHLIYVQLIDIDGDRAVAETYVDADAHTRRSGRAVRLRALYRDVMTKRDSEWRYQERRIVGMRSLDDAGRP